MPPALQSHVELFTQQNKVKVGSGFREAAGSPPPRCIAMHMVYTSLGTTKQMNMGCRVDGATATGSAGVSQVNRRQPKKHRASVGEHGLVCATKG